MREFFNTRSKSQKYFWFPVLLVLVIMLCVILIEARKDGEWFQAIIGTIAGAVLGIIICYFVDKWEKRGSGRN